MIVAIMLLSSSVESLSQVFNETDVYGNSLDGSVDPTLQDADSLAGKKEKREKKPMESYLFSDSTRNQNIFSWQVNPLNNNIKIISIDTMLNDFQKDYKFFQNNRIGSVYNGNLGGASTSLDYFERVNSNTFSFLDAYHDYLFSPDNVPFYNAKKPFTQMAFFMSGQTSKAEEQLRIIHQQNISPSTAINVTYRNNGTKGMYYNQTAKDKNLSLAVNHTGRKYTAHGGYIYNRGDIDENGGVTDLFYVRDTLIDLTENVPTNLRDANNSFRSNTFYITQSYGMPFRRIDADSVEFNIRDKSAIFFGHALEYTSASNVYTDSYDYVVEGFYDNWYINPQMSRDSISETNFTTSAFVQLQPYDRDGLISLFGGGIGYQHESYYYFKPGDYLYNPSSTTENSVYVYANAQGGVKEYFKWDGDFKYYPIGYRSQDMDVSARMLASAAIKDNPIELTAKFRYRMETPSFWDEHYYSNHYKWDNSFPKEIETRIEGELSIPSHGIKLGANQSVITNKVYYDENSMPALYSGALSVSAVYLQKDFRIGGLNLKNRVLLQWSSSQEVAPVPYFSANGIYYYEFNVVKDVLRMQIGVEGYYNSSYYGLGYNPAIMQYYNQRDIEVGDYIWMDAYISGKWKRVRFLVKMQHLNNELFGGRNYFQVASYPLNRQMLKFGLSWNFYD